MKTGQIPLSSSENKVDFQALFESTPGCYLVLKPVPEFTILAVNNAYLRATLTQREAILGKGIFEAFPDNTADLKATGVSNLRASLERVATNRVSDTMPIQKYDIRRQSETGGDFEERYWCPINTPVLDSTGTVNFIIHRVEDVTEFMQLKQKENEQNKLKETLQARTEQLEAEIYSHLKEIERKKEALKISNERYQILTTMLPVGVFHADLAGKCLYTNPYWQEITGFNPEEALGKQWFISAHTADRQRISETWQQNCKNKGSCKFEFRLVLPSGKEHWALANIVPEVKGEEKQIQGYIGSLTDITERKVAEEQAQKRAEALAEIDRTKTVFFGNVTHEFRTPLTLIIGPIEDVLADSEQALPLRQQERIALIYRNALRLSKLVNSLLDFSRLEAGRVQAAYEPIDLAKFTNDLVSIFRAPIEKAELKLNVDLVALDEVVYVDKDMWEKIVFNLLSNAIKYTFQGAITITLKKQQAAIELSIADTGTGIPKKELPRLFERFYRVEGVRGRSYEGVGIGLALVQELAKLHGGSARVESEVGKGSIFTVTIPLGKTHLPANQVKASSSPQGRTRALGSVFSEEALRWLPQESKVLPLKSSDNVPTEIKQILPKGKILVVDDSVDIREYLHNILSPHWKVWLAEDGEVALQMIQKEKPDLILSDVMMPKMNGLQLAQALRSKPETKALPIIFLSSWIGEEARIESIQCGASDYLEKPFSAKELIARINLHLKLRSFFEELETKVAERTQELQQTINELKQTQSALTKSEETYRNLATISPAGIFHLDKEGQNYYLNQRGCEIIGLKEEEAKGSGWTQTLHPEDKERIISEWQKLREEKINRFKQEYRFLRRNGTIASVIGEVITEKDENQQIKGHVGVLTDITELKELEKSRLEAVQKAEELQRKRAQEAEDNQKRLNDFIATMCHELRNPLNGIFGNIDLLETSMTTLEKLIQAVEAEKLHASLRNEILNHIARDKESISAISICTKQEKVIADDVLSLSKLETGKIELHWLDFDPKIAIKDVANILETEINRKNLHLSLKLTQEDIKVKGDSEHLKRVLLNLLSNAIKFTSEKDTITIGLSVLEQTTSHTILQFIVEGTGMGITTEEEAQIFNRFTQASHKTYQEYGGSGLELVISKNLVELMDGKIDIESKKEHGTKFTFTIKTKNIIASQEEAPSQSLSLFADSTSKHKTAHILIVEDNIINQKVLKRQLEQAGYCCHVAINGQEAVAMLGKISMDVILMDVEMPVMSGLEATKMIRQKEQELKHLPVVIIGLSGNALQKQKEEALCSGMNDYLVKPYDKNTLLERIASCTHTQPAITSEKNI